MKVSRAIWGCAICGPALAGLVALSPIALAQDQADLAKASQNPVADLISLPFQNNTFFGVGPDDDVANVLNIQPVISIKLGPVNLINRTIFPLIYLPDVTAGLAELPEGISGGSTFGLGDINYTGFLSPVGSGPSHLGHRPLDQLSDRDRREARQREMERRAVGGRAGDARAPGSSARWSGSCGRSPGTTTGRTSASC